MFAIFDIDHIRDRINQRTQQVTLFRQSLLGAFTVGNITDRTD